MSLRTPSDIPGWTAGRHQGARAHLLGVFAFRSFPVWRELAPPTKAGKTWIAAVLRSLPMNSFCRSEVMSHLPPCPPPSSGGRSSRDAAQGVFAFGFILGFDQRGGIGSARQRLALPWNPGGASRCGRGSNHREVRAGVGAFPPAQQSDHEKPEHPAVKTFPILSNPASRHLRTQIPRPNPGGSPNRPTTRPDRRAVSSPVRRCVRSWIPASEGKSGGAKKTR
jgi:hypothetical protein